MKTALPRTVIILGLVSFLNDLGSDIVLPLLPILLVSVLGAGPVVLGFVEGVADAVASLLKLWSGRRSDLLGGKRKTLTLMGYALSNIARPLIGLSMSWWMVMILRSTDRMGKGLRSAPRDALLVDVTPPQIRGYAFGFHRAMDNGGAVGGALVAAAVVAWSSLSLAQVIMLSAIPGFLAVLLVGTGIKDVPAMQKKQTLPPLKWSVLEISLQRYLKVFAVFAFAQASETFILLLGYNLKIPVVELLLLWAALNFTKAITSTWGGQIADKIGRAHVLMISWIGFALSFYAYAATTDIYLIWAITLFFGLLRGFSEGAERALISDYAQDVQRGTAFGWYYFISGIAAIPAGLLFGAVWHYLGASIAFLMAGGIVTLAVALFMGYVNPTLKRGEK
jgi:MFS family permease